MKKFLLIILFLGIKTLCFSQQTIPYTNHFDNPGDTLGWSHYAISGTDDWELGIPNTNYFSTAHSYQNAWVTNLDGPTSTDSITILETPYFDLSDTSTSYILSFFQKRKAYNNYNTHYYLEYTTDSGSTWLHMDDPNTTKKNWQGSSGFYGNYYLSWFQHSAIDIGFIQGNDSIKFRFRFDNTGGIYGDGWMIDDFSISEEYYNIVAEQGDTILGVNSNFTQFDISFNYNFNNQWNDVYYTINNFYFSNDTIIDATDIFLDSVSSNFYSYYQNWTNTLTLPTGINAGTHYILYELDVLNTVPEGDETDNISYAVIEVDSIYPTPFIEDFDSGNNGWNTGIYTNNSLWKLGDPNKMFEPNAHSGGKAWKSGESTLSFENYLESPYINLDTSINTVLCFWYRAQNTYIDNPYMDPEQKLKLILPVIDTTLASFFIFPTPSTYINWDDYNFFIGNNRNYDYDCYCKEISSYDGENYFKFLIESGYNSSPNLPYHSIFDDFYVGSPKPDISLEGEKHFRFTSSNIATNSLKYTVYNSGLSQLPITNTAFYWSNDDILDSTDTYLGTNTEPLLTDTSFQENEFTYTKPTLVNGDYFIFYKADSANQISEMREYNNIGYFKVKQISTQSLPYNNNFEGNTDGWSHKATLGEDEWQLTLPQGASLDTSFSGVQAFITNDTGAVSPNTRLHLFSPIFDLSQLQKPIVEFDMKLHHPLIYFSQFYASNLMYSTDNGFTWNTVFNPEYFNPLYNRVTYDFFPGDGIDYYSAPTSFYESNYLLYGKDIPTFIPSNWYRGKDMDNIYHHSIDVSNITDNNQIQFMFTYSNENSISEGIMIDNFEIKEAHIDLNSPTLSKFMVRSNDHLIRQNIRIKNSGNSPSESTSVNVYCSTDNLLDSSDFFLTSIDIPALIPNKNFLFNLKELSPPNYEIYNYLVLDIDPLEDIDESNELNNQHFLELNMDTSSNFNYPILFDFNDSIMNGWTWYHDSITNIHGHRFRHLLYPNDILVSGNTSSGEWFLDKQYGNGDFSTVPTHYIESPAFDFEFLTDIQLNFDFLCVGSYYGTDSETMGGNLQFSVDGGTNWDVLTLNQDPNAQNWYDQTSIGSLNLEPGWTYIPNWQSASYNLTFLSGQSSIRFRYKFRSNNYPSSPSTHGFRMDNFQISATQFSLTPLPNIEICEGDSALVFGHYQTESNFFYDTLTDINGADSILKQELIVNLTSYNYQTVYSCDSFIWSVDSAIYDSSGVYIATITNELNCDSIISLDLIIVEIDTSVTTSGYILSSNSTGSTYKWLNCNQMNLPVPGETNQTFIASSNGFYSVEITKNGCVDTSACHLVSNVGIIENDMHSEINIFPNPSNGIFTIDLGQVYSEINLSITDILDNEIQSYDAKNTKIFTIELNQPSGIYFLRIKSDNHQLVYKLIKK